MLPATHASMTRPMNGKHLLLLALVLLGFLAWQQRGAAPPAAPDGAAASFVPESAHAPALPSFLPPEAGRTVALIRRGGPFPHAQDGGVFQNREGRLPRQPRGWYREYTVRTPGERTRGARRIVTGGDPPVAWYYTGDHYRSFRRFEVPQ